MGDIICRICGEPWDAYGVYTKTDVTEEEAKLILSGKGCPSCKGKKRTKPSDTDLFEDLEYTDLEYL